MTLEKSTVNSVMNTILISLSHISRITVRLKYLLELKAKKTIKFFYYYFSYPKVPRNSSKGLYTRYRVCPTYPNKNLRIVISEECLKLVPYAQVYV